MAPCLCVGCGGLYVGCVACVLAVGGGGRGAEMEGRTNERVGAQCEGAPVRECDGDSGVGWGGCRVEGLGGRLE